MKLQYTCSEHTTFQYIIRLWFDGLLVKSYKVYLDELNDEIDKIEKQGYVLGYTREEVEEARLKYEEMLNNIILKKSGQ